MKAVKLAPLLFLIFSSTIILHKKFHIPAYTRYNLYMYSNPQHQAQALSGSSLFDYLLFDGELINENKNCPNIFIPYHQNTIYNFEHYYIVLSYYIKDSDITKKPFKIMRKDKQDQLFYHPLKQEDLLSAYDCSKWLVEAEWYEEGKISSINVFQLEDSIKILYMLQKEDGNLMLKDIIVPINFDIHQPSLLVNERELDLTIDSVAFFNGSYFWNKKKTTILYKDADQVIGGHDSKLQLVEIEPSETDIKANFPEFDTIDFFKFWFFQSVRSPHGDLLLRLYEIKKSMDVYLFLTILTKTNGLHQIKIKWVSVDEIASCSVSSSESGIMIIVNSEDYFIVFKDEKTGSYELETLNGPSKFEIKIHDYNKVQLIENKNKKTPYLAHISPETMIPNIYLVDVGLNNLWDNACVMQKENWYDNSHNGFFIVKCTGDIFWFSQLSKDTFVFGLLFWLPVFQFL